MPICTSEDHAHNKDKSLYFVGERERKREADLHRCDRCNINLRRSKGGWGDGGWDGCVKGMRVGVRLSNITA